MSGRVMADMVWLQIIITVLNNSVYSLRYPTLSMPSYIREGGDVNFNCNYSVPVNKFLELDIKVYFGDSTSPLLVFLPSLQTTPQIVDQTYEEIIEFPHSDSSAGKTALSFQLKGTKLNMSGLYTCKVSTNTEEFITTKRLTVYSKFIIQEQNVREKMNFIFRTTKENPVGCL